MVRKTATDKEEGGVAAGAMLDGTGNVLIIVASAYVQVAVVLPAAAT